MNTHHKRDNKNERKCENNEVKYIPQECVLNQINIKSGAICTHVYMSTGKSNRNAS